MAPVTPLRTLCADSLRPVPAEKECSPVRQPLIPSDRIVGNPRPFRHGVILTDPT